MGMIRRGDHRRIQPRLLQELAKIGVEFCLGKSLTCFGYLLAAILQLRIIVESGSVRPFDYVAKSNDPRPATGVNLVQVVSPLPGNANHADMQFVVGQLLFLVLSECGTGPKSKCSGNRARLQKPPPG